MRLISALLCFCLTFNVMAASGTVTELEKALDEYQYSLTVEWDQKDPAFMTARTEAFYASLSDLMNKGLTQEEVLAVVSKKSKNPKEIEALKLKMEALAGKASSANELAEAITANSKGMYASGASWEGSAILISVGIVALVGAAIAYSIWFDKSHTCVATAQGEQCGWVSPYQGAPASQQYYQCWTTTYCTEYVEN
jgi:hypothetical protein